MRACVCVCVISMFKSFSCYLECVSVNVAFSDHTNLFIAFLPERIVLHWKITNVAIEVLRKILTVIGVYKN